MADDITPNEAISDVTADTSATQDTTVAETTDAPGDKAAISAPVDYSDFTFPEGVKPDEGTLSEFKTLAKEAKLSQDAAQKLIDLQIKTEKSKHDRETKAWSDMQAKWVEDVKADPEVGGVDYQEKLAIANKAFKQYGDKDLHELFKFTGVGNHVAMVRFMYKLGKTLSESDVVTGRSGAQERDVAKLLYPTMNK